MELFIDPPARTPVTRFNGVILKRLFAGALTWLEQHYERVNLLNVFPVPDGDTGTNLLLTMRNAYAEIADSDSPEVGVIAVRFAHGALRGSRGNSGTILSEMLRGFANRLNGAQLADAVLTAQAFREATRLAYAVVQKPVEGTILTVARETADAIEQAVRETPDLREVLYRATIASQRAVARTPELLPILRQAGVVDSGGQGLAYLIEGMWRATIDDQFVESPTSVNGQRSGVPVAKSAADLRSTLSAADPLGYGYDVQYVIRGSNLDIAAVRDAIGAMGDSMVVVGDVQLIKVHIHVHDPGKPLSYGAKLGVLEEVIVENMQVQADDYLAGRAQQADQVDAPPNVTPDQIAVVAVAPGMGLRRVLRGVGASIVIDGGQTMNPSSGALIDAIESLNTDRVILLPNNKNIQLTAEQAARAVTHKQVRVVPTRNIPQGVAALLAFSAEDDLDTVVAQMTEARVDVHTGEVTTATRSIELNGVVVQNGAPIGLIDGTLAVSGTTVPEVVEALLAQLAAETHELITLYYGAEVSSAEANALVESLGVHYPTQEFEIFEGGQPHYAYILSVE